MIQVQGLAKHYGNFVAVQRPRLRGRARRGPGARRARTAPARPPRCAASPASFAPTRGRGHDRRPRPATRPGRGQARARLHSRRAAPLRLPDRREHLASSARLYGVADAPSAARALLEELELADKARRAARRAVARHEAEARHRLRPAARSARAAARRAADRPRSGRHPPHEGDDRRARARRGAAIVLSSHLLHLVEEIADRVLILQSGRRVALGTLAEIRALAPGLSQDASLEDIFLTVTARGDQARLVIDGLLLPAAHPFRNRLTRRLARLREPRYFVPFAVSLLWFGGMVSPCRARRLARAAAGFGVVAARRRARRSSSSAASGSSCGSC